MISKEELFKYFKKNFIEVYVIPNSSEQDIYYDNNRNKVVIKLKEKPVDNLANTMLIKLMRKEYGLSLIVIKGLHSKQKILQLI